jgi:hypothetical protein
MQKKVQINKPFVINTIEPLGYQFVFYKENYFEENDIKRLLKSLPKNLGQFYKKHIDHKAYVFFNPIKKHYLSIFIADNILFEIRIGYFTILNAQESNITNIKKINMNLSHRCCLTLLINWHSKIVSFCIPRVYISNINDPKALFKKNVFFLLNLTRQTINEPLINKYIKPINEIEMEDIRTISKMPYIENFISEKP